MSQDKKRHKDWHVHLPHLHLPHFHLPHVKLPPIHWPHFHIHFHDRPLAGEPHPERPFHWRLYLCEMVATAVLMVIDLARVLLDVARIQDGENPKDPTAFAQRLTGLLTVAAKGE